jgi:serine protease Do
MAMTVARQLIKKGHVSRAYVGVHLDRDFDAAKSAEQLGLARPVGARVSGITPNSPAAKANLRVDDVIVQLNGKWIEDDDHLISQVSVTAVGESVELTVIRERRPFRVRLSVGDRAKFEPDSER